MDYSKRIQKLEEENLILTETLSEVLPVINFMQTMKTTHIKKEKSNGEKV